MPVHGAAAGGWSETVTLPLDAGQDVNIPDGGGDTPLHHAARASRLQTVRMLSDAGADPNARGIKGRTPLQAAEESLARGFVDPAVIGFLRGYAAGVNSAKAASPAAGAIVKEAET